MKRVILLFAALSINYFVNAQTVENITVQSEDEKIIITYRIGGSTEAQYYNVILNCSMDAGSRFEPKTVIGDVGKNIRGGRSYYKIEWDVFEDVDKVGNVEFFIKVDMTSDMAPVVIQQQNQPTNQPINQPQDKTGKRDIKETNPGLPDVDYDAVGDQKEEIPWGSYLAYSGSTASKIGLSFGTLKNVGVYGSFRFGTAITEYQTDIWFTLVGGLTKHIFRSGIYKLYGYGGAGITYEVFEEYTYNTTWNISYLTIDAGVINTIGRLDLNLGLEFVRGVGTFPVFGIGFAF